MIKQLRTKLLFVIFLYLSHKSTEMVLFYFHNILLKYSYLKDKDVYCASECMEEQ